MEHLERECPSQALSRHFPSLPEPANLGAVFSRFPKGAKALLELHDSLLRGDSSLSIAERELLAAHVSNLNACRYCHGAHASIAESYGISPLLLKSLQENSDTAELPEKFKPIIAYVTKLTLTPSKMVEEDSKVVYDAGWDEAALYDAVTVCALFNFMNRVVEGTGCLPKSSPDKKQAGKTLESYLEWGKGIGFID